MIKNKVKVGRLVLFISFIILGNSLAMNKASAMWDRLKEEERARQVQGGQGNNPIPIDRPRPAHPVNPQGAQPDQDDIGVMQQQRTAAWSLANNNTTPQHMKAHHLDVFNQLTQQIRGLGVEPNRLN